MQLIMLNDSTSVEVNESVARAGVAIKCNTPNRSNIVVVLWVTMRRPRTQVLEHAPKQTRQNP